MISPPDSLVDDGETVILADVAIPDTVDAKNCDSTPQDSEVIPSDTELLDADSSGFMDQFADINDNLSADATPEVQEEVAVEDMQTDSIEDVVPVCLVDDDCSDGDDCNGLEFCSQGECQPGVPPLLDDGNDCTDDLCIPDEGVVHPAVSNGSACDDGDACTQTDECQGGECLGFDPTSCPAGEVCQGPGVCDPGTGACSYPNVPDFTSCSDEDVCNGSEQCESGACTAGEPLVLSDDDPCTMDLCDPLSGVSHPPAGDGLACNDGDACTQVDTCIGGICIGGDLTTCEDTGQCEDVAVCDPATGFCEAEELPDGTPCDDEDGCTQTDECQDGVCMGFEPSMCPEGDVCQGPGVCDSGSGTCSYPDLPDFTPCGDGNPCNGNETCQSGACVSGDPPTLDDGNPCTADLCDPDSGEIHPPYDDGIACDDGDPATWDGVCEAGMCQPGPTIPLSFLPDTGQVVCYNDTGTIACGDEDSPWFGQDGDFLPQPMAYETSIPGVVGDLVTGLLWEQDASTTQFNYTQAVNHCAALALAGLEWRLPNRRELLTIVDYGAMSNQGPTIAPVFSQTQSAYYWTTDTSGTNPDRKMRVSFKYGTSQSQDDGFQDGYVRCVTGNAVVSAQELIAIPQEFSVYDPTAGLIWQRVPSGYLIWQGALDYCQNLDSLGADRWRLPDVRELATLLIPEEAYPVLDPALFPGIKSGEVMWTSTTSNKPTSLNQAYIVGLGDQGTIGTGKKTDNYQVLCVRACPCPDPECCRECKPLEDGFHCDDGDPSTWWDRCDDGFCFGDPVGSPAPPKEPPFDCESLECGPGGVCINDGGIETCLCSEGYLTEGSACVPDPAWVPTETIGCIPFDAGTTQVCLMRTGGSFTGLPGAPPAGPQPSPGEDGQQEDSPADLSSEVLIDPPSGFQPHAQFKSQWCVPHSLNAALELLLGELYIGLSEAHSLCIWKGAPCSDQTQHPDACKAINWSDFLNSLSSTDYLVPDSVWPIDYANGGQCSSISFDPMPSGLEPEGIASLLDFEVLQPSKTSDFAALLDYLETGYPVLAFVPIAASPNEWKTWSSGKLVTISDKPWSIEKWGACGGNPLAWEIASISKCICLTGADCTEACNVNPACWILHKKDYEFGCRGGVCTLGNHAVVLVGYHEAPGEASYFYFLNSWDSSGGRWGVAFEDYPAGIGRMTFDFVHKHVDYLAVVKELGLRCADPSQDGACIPGHAKCKDSSMVETCSTLPNGCLGYVDDKDCNPPWQCQDGDCVPKVGDGWCMPGAEDCSTSPSDCPCPDGALCQDGQCTMTCSHECEVGDVGCVDSTTRWFCGFLADGDPCRDVAPLDCAAGEVCQDGGCVTDCVQSHKACKPGTDEVWWYDSCDAPLSWVVTCPGDCQDGACEAVCPPYASTGCHDGDVYHFDSCGDPHEVATPCGTSGPSGAPYCSADHQSAIQDYFLRGCADAVCFSDYDPVVTPCGGGACGDGQCVAGGTFCGDGVCAPGAEDCGGCLLDCPCWSGNAPHCGGSGQCVQCLDSSHCPDGSTCEGGSCVSGCHECSPAGIYRCGPGGEREVCTQVFNCRMWIDSSCGWAEGCCQGECVSTTPPPSPIPLLPASGATITGTVHFEWAYAGAANRVTLAICSAPNLQGTCIIKEPEPTWWYLNVSLPPGDYWWAVRGITACDMSGWGEYSEILELHIP